MIRSSPARDPLVAYVRFPIPEGCHPEGEDVRVVDARERPCPGKLMFFEPALYGIVAFEVKPDTEFYWVYLGNQDPGRSLADWEPHAGVFLETRRIEGNRADSWQDVQAMLELGRYAFGAGYRPIRMIHDGFNPYGPSDGYLGIYTAYLRVSRAGTYDFSTASDDASFLWINDKLVCQWPGRHKVHGGLQGEHQGTINLPAGTHELRYYHVEFEGRQAAMAAWRPHGDYAFDVIQEHEFTPILEGFLYDLEERDQAVTANFEVQPLEYLEWGDRTLIAYKFTDRSIVFNDRINKRRWKFSDGPSSEARQFSRVFFSSGDHEITLSVEDGRGRTATTTRPLRVRAVDRASSTDLEFIAESFADLVRSMPIDELNDDDMFVAADFLYRKGEYKAAVGPYRRWIERQWSQGLRPTGEAMLAVAEMLADHLDQPEPALRFCREQMKRLPENHPIRAMIGLKLGRLQFERFDQPDQALVTLDEARDALLAADQREDVLREIWIARGDACRALGRCDQAREAYHAAGSISTGKQARVYDMVSYGLMVESYLKQDLLEKAEPLMEEWIERFPQERLTGYASLLEARLRLARHDRDAAIIELETVLRCDPPAVYARQALEMLGGLYDDTFQPEKAIAAYQAIIDNYDDPEDRKRIKRKIEALGPLPGR